MPRSLVVYSRRCVPAVAGTRKAVTDIVQLCFDAGEWQTLNEQIQLISKRRGQLKQTVQSMVQQAMQYIDQTPDLDSKIELIKSLKCIGWEGDPHAEFLPIYLYIEDFEDILEPIPAVAGMVERALERSGR